MSHVTNILTGRRILESNAAHSNYHGGYIHVNSAKVVIKSVEVKSSMYSSRSIVNDFVSDETYNNWMSNDLIKNIITFNNDGNQSMLSIVLGYTEIINGTKYTHSDGREYYYPTPSNDADMVEINGQIIPWYCTIEYTELVQSNSNVLSFKEYKNLYHTNPSSIPNLVNVFMFGETKRCFRYWNDGYSVRRESLSINGIVKKVLRSDYTIYRNATRNQNSIYGYHGSASYRTTYDHDIQDGQWAFGIEAEKQDSLALSYARYLGGNCDGWSAERDSSLGSGGVEFISPILPLHNGSLVRKNFQQHAWLLNAAIDDNGNADKNKCGGHITISKKGMSGSELLGHLHHFVPLFYSLYIGRLNGSYSSAISKNNVSRTRQAFNVKSFGIEIRIFSGVPSMEGAWWRVQLLQAITNMIDSGEVQSYKDVANALVTDKHPLRKVMRKMYDSKRIRDKFALVLSLGHMYENGNSRICIENTSNDVKHKSDRVISAFNEFSDVRRCTSRIWGISSISVE